jgi:hypothetical protein
MQQLTKCHLAQHTLYLNIYYTLLNISFETIPHRCISFTVYWFRRLDLNIKYHKYCNSY